MMTSRKMNNLIRLVIILLYDQPVAHSRYIWTAVASNNTCTLMDQPVAKVKSWDTKINYYFFIFT